MIAFVLHAHLPWLRDPSRDRREASQPGAVSLEERWFFDALWECYLPLLGVFHELSSEPVTRPVLTLSLSPTLLAMLRDPALPVRFARFADDLDASLASKAAASPAFDLAIADARGRLAASREAFEVARGDVVGDLVALADRGVLELATTAATHAFLPSLRTAEAVRAQLRMGMRYFTAVTKRPPGCLWLPECGYDERLEPLIADSGARATVLAAHGVELARPRPPHGTFEPIVGDGPVAYFGRSNEVVDLVWSPDTGYPGHAHYRDFHAREPLANGASLKPLAISRGAYDPAAAAYRARAHATHFVETAMASSARSSSSNPILVAAFDAELFGHWWWEGPSFLRHVLGELVRRQRATSLSAWLEDDPTLAVARPSTSTWGRGGYSGVWAHPTSGHAARVVHRAERRVLLVDALVRDTPRSETQRLARLWAIRELFLLQASDYAFMLHSGEFADFAQNKLREHATAIEALAAVAERPVEAPGDRRLIDEWIARRPLFRELDEDAWSDAFDPW